MATRNTGGTDSASKRPLNPIGDFQGKQEEPGEGQAAQQRRPGPTKRAVGQ